MKTSYLALIDCPILPVVSVVWRAGGGVRPHRAGAFGHSKLPENVWLTPQMKTDLTNLAAVQANINVVAGAESNMQAIVDIADIEAVSGSIANVDAVGTDIDNVNAVGTDIANVNAVAANLSDVAALVPSAGDLNTISTNLPGLLAAIGSETNAAAGSECGGFGSNAANSATAATSEGLASQWSEFAHYNFQMARMPNSMLTMPRHSRSSGDRSV